MSNSQTSNPTPRQKIALACVQYRHDFMQIQSVENKIHFLNEHIRSTYEDDGCSNCKVKFASYEADQRKKKQDQQNDDNDSSTDSSDSYETENSDSGSITIDWSNDTNSGSGSKSGSDSSDDSDSSEDSSSKSDEVQKKAEALAKKMFEDMVKAQMKEASEAKKAKKNKSKKAKDKKNKSKKDKSKSKSDEDRLVMIKRKPNTSKDRNIALQMTDEETQRRLFAQFASNPGSVLQGMPSGSTINATFVQSGATVHQHYNSGPQINPGASWGHLDCLKP